MGASGTGRRILIVDDEPIMVETLRFALAEAGYACEEAADGDEALRRIAERPPDLVLLDVMLPGRNGYQVCRALKAAPELRTIPVVMLTARAQERDRMVGRESGADAYLAKPFAMGDLLDLVARLLAAPTR